MSNKISVPTKSLNDTINKKVRNKNIDMVFHAAALKQVPSAEYNPIEFESTYLINKELFFILLRKFLSDKSNWTFEINQENQEKQKDSNYQRPIAVNA